MTNPDLRTFLSDLQKAFPSEVLRIPQEVPLDHTSTALVAALEKQGRRPVVWLERLAGQSMPLVCNLFASRGVMAFAVGASEAGLHARIGECLDHLVPSTRVPAGPVQEVVLEGEEADLARLPVPHHFEGDAGAYITAGITVARDPDTGVGNLSYARLQVKGAHEMGVSLHSRQHLWDYHRRAELAGKDLPVAVVIGCHPAVMVAAAARMGIDQDEYDLAGALLDQPLELCRARTVDVDVPANAEMVIEGTILAGKHEPEGPFAEYTGYMTDRSTRNVMAVTAITMRREPIYVDIIPGNSAEHLTLGRVSKEAWVFKRLREAYPFFVDFHYPPSGTHYHCYLRINKTAEGQARQIATLAMGLDSYIKLAVVVDKDIDPHNEADVLWAVATRAQADRDVNILTHSLCNPLDPSSSNGVSAKMMIDATMPLDSTAKRIVVPPEAEANAERILRELGSAAGK